jgi:hypothetical protein
LSFFCFLVTQIFAGHHVAMCSEGAYALFSDNAQTEDGVRAGMAKKREEQKDFLSVLSIIWRKSEIGSSGERCHRTGESAGDAGRSPAGQRNASLAETGVIEHHHEVEVEAECILMSEITVSTYSFWVQKSEKAGFLDSAEDLLKPFGLAPFAITSLKERISPKMRDAKALVDVPVLIREEKCFFSRGRRGHLACTRSSTW